MRLWRESSVLVLIVFVSILAASTWVSGCAGFAEPLPQLSVTPNSLSVSTTVGSASSQVVTVANIGSATIGISQANVIGAGFSVAGLRLPLTLSPGQGANFSVKFVPSTASSVDGTLSLVTDTQHRPIVLQLHGKAAPANAPVTSVALSPASASPAVNGRVQFTATVQGTTTDHSVTWSATIGTVTSNGLYTAPATAGAGVVTATSVADPTRSASAPVTVTAAPGSNPNPPSPDPAVTSVTISPASAKSATSGTLSFTASVQGSTSNKSVTWKASLGTITPSGLYTAPASAGTATVTATSVADTTKSASAVVTVTAAPAPPPNPTVTSVSVSPASTSATVSGTLQFTASVQGTASDKSVTWKASLGSITASGLYTAPSKAGTDTVTATSDADSSKSGNATVSVTAAAPTPPPSGNTVSLLTFGNAGFGGDDTSVFQTALNSTASHTQILEIPAGSYNISPINFPSNSHMKVDAGVTVSANSGYGSSDRMLNINSTNVTISGAGGSTSVFQMPKARTASQGDGSQYRHCLGIQNASNVTVTGIACNQSGGDGIYVSAATNVTITNCVFDKNYRDAGSIIGRLNHINISNNVFSNTNGTAPQAGVDLEPNNPGDFVVDVNFTDNTMVNNSGDGLAISLWTLDSTSQPVSITVTRNHSDHNGRYGYFANNNDPSNAAGTITLNDCTTDQSGSDGANARFYSANGASLTFNNLTVTNPHRNGPDPSYGDSVAVAIIRGGGASVPEGNVHYRNVNVSVTNGKVTYYFDFHDGSNIGVSNVTFTPGTLSGASQAPPNGLLSGQTMNSVGQ
jgi:parallel beta helix pectate lyase-like protein